MPTAVGKPSLEQRFSDTSGSSITSVWTTSAILCLTQMLRALLLKGKGKNICMGGCHDPYVLH